MFKGIANSKSWYEVEFENSNESGKISFFATNSKDAERQFFSWWDFRTDWLKEHLPIPNHWISATWSAD
jgi:hypothetical protein